MTDYSNNDSRPTKIIINLQSYGYNLEIAKELSRSDIIAVVKADAYGHGAKEIAKYAYEKHRITHFAVATLEEAITLREMPGFNADIIILGYIKTDNLRDIFINKLTPTIFDDKFAKELNNFMRGNNSNIKVAIKIDTGMHRLGFDYNFNIYEFYNNYPMLTVAHVMSHLSSADTDRHYTNLQIKRFNEFLKNNNITTNTSLFNSSALCAYENVYTLTRPGIMTYGYVTPQKNINLQKVMKVYSKVVHIKNVGAGEYISYNGTYKTQKPMKIGVIPVGYADGYMRKLSNCGYMLLDGKKCNVLGNICMDMTIIDITEISEASITKDVEILGDNVTADELGNMTGTIPYEVLCNFSSRIKRYYKE